jgi:hypothetical protein
VTVPAGSPLRQVHHGHLLCGGEGDVSAARGALCELGTDASLEGSAVLIKPGRSALACG